MHELIELRRKRDTYLATAQSILTKAIGEQRALTEAENTDVAGLRAKAQSIADTIKHAEDLRAMTAGATSGTRDNGYQLFADTAGSAESRGPFQSLGEQLRSVVMAGRGGNQPDPKLFEVRAASGLNEAVPSEAGFLVQTDFSTSLLQGAMAAAKLAPRCAPFPIGPNSNGVTLPAIDETSRATGSRFGGLQLAWGAEAGDIVATKPKFKQLALKLNKLTGACYLTDEIVQDATVLDSFVRRAFTAEYAFTIDDRILRGSGAGQPLGILTSGALVTVDKETGQAADTIVTQNVVRMFARSSNPEGSVWLANINTFPQLSMLTLAVGTGGTAVGLLREGIAGSPTGLGMLGRPIIFMEQCSTLGDVGDLIFADMSRYLLATKGGLQVASSIHVRFLQDENVLRFIQRLDGQPEVSAPLTPYQGSGDTVSPFVVLAAR